MTAGTLVERVPAVAVRPATTDATLVIALTLGACALRVVVGLLTVDVPGDGPTRAIAAWEWTAAPRIVLFGVWPPGLVYLAGLVGTVVPDPFWSVRLVNLAAGTMTVPLAYVTVRRAFGRDVAVTVAALLALLPLHVELSASSLAETSFVLEVLLGTWVVCFVAAPRPWQWGVGLAALFWATMTRYEAWWLVPPLVAAAGWTRQRWTPALAVGLAMSVFPCVWTLGNWHALGDPFYGFSMAQKGAELAGTPAVPLGSALGALVVHVGTALGWPAVLGIGVGLVAALARPRRPSRALAAWAMLAATFWAAMTWFAMRRGASLLDRYVLLGLVLLLPWAVAPWTRLAARSARTAALVAAVLLGGMLGPRLDRWPPSTTWITWTRPVDVEALVVWLRRSPYRDAPVVLTSMQWQASYFAAFWPEAADRRLIVSEWTEDDELRRFLALRRPALLVTMRGDEEMRARIARLGGAGDVEPTPLATFGAVEVHRVHHGSR